jgi:hypothetical protein
MERDLSGDGRIDLDHVKVSAKGRRIGIARNRKANCSTALTARRTSVLPQVAVQIKNQPPKADFHNPLMSTCAERGHKARPHSARH